MTTTIAVLAALDTKAEDADFLRARIVARGHDVLLIDIGVLGVPGVGADIHRDAVATAGGRTIEELRSAGDRAEAVAVMAIGATRIVDGLYRQGAIHGVLGLGGGAGTSIGAAAMHALPMGVPKVILSTVASGDTTEYVGTSDIVMFPSIVDVAGVNRISAVTYARAADAIAGMVTGEAESPTVAPTEGRPVIAASMFGVTTAAVSQAKLVLEEAGYEVVVFHATGMGGRTMERLIADGYVDAVLDLTTTEWADQVVGGILGAGPDRLTAAAVAGLPQVVSVGATDMVNFGPRSTVPTGWADRLFYQHNAENTLMRVTPDEAREIGKEIGVRVAAATGPTTVLLPTSGVSALDIEGGPFESVVAREALSSAVVEALAGSPVEVRRIDRHINDQEFATHAAETLLDLITKRTLTQARNGEGHE